METITERFDHRPKVTKSRRQYRLPPNPEGKGRFPSWLHRKLPKKSAETESIINKQHLHTVCEEAKCPNRTECWSSKTATFLIMGKECTRCCGFCDIDFSKTPKALELDEPERVADSVKLLELKHAVITMVSRDDLQDGGASHLVATIKAIRNKCPDTTVEVLTSDFDGNLQALETVLNAKPEIFNHNIETIRELTPKVRHRATYERTLQTLNYAHQHRHENQWVKSGIMVGLGETDEQIKQTIRDLHQVGCDIITIGQYLQPSHNQLRVKAFITPEQFKTYEEYGYSIGIKNMYCGPFVRSSYNAGHILKQTRLL